jgi:hypothetical protein
MDSRWQGYQPTDIGQMRDFCDVDIKQKALTPIL